MRLGYTPENDIQHFLPKRPDPLLFGKPLQATSLSGISSHGIDEKSVQTR